MPMLLTHSQAGQEWADQSRQPGLQVYRLQNEAYVMTSVDWATRCFLGIRAVFQRTQTVGQQMVHQARAEQYYSDQFSMYDSLNYRRGHHLSPSD